MGGSIITPPSSGGVLLNLGLNIGEDDHLLFNPLWEDWQLIQLSGLLAVKGAAPPNLTAVLELTGQDTIVEAACSGFISNGSNIASFLSATEILIPSLVKNTLLDDLYVSRFIMQIQKGQLNDSSMFGWYRSHGLNSPTGPQYSFMGQFKIQWTGTIDGIDFYTGNDLVLFQAGLASCYSFGLVRR